MAVTRTWDPQRNEGKPLSRTVVSEFRDVGDYEIELSFSSEEPVRRWWGLEILGHEESDVDLRRLNDGGVILFAHGRDPNFGVMPVGRVVSAWIDRESRKGRARVAFDQDEDAQKVLGKIRSGTLRGVSVGYEIREVTEIGEGETFRGITGPADLVTRWVPFEVSIEPTPADPTVGIGRSMEDMDHEIEVDENESEFEGGNESMSEQMNEVRDIVNEEEVRAKAAAEERARVAEIVSLCRDFDVDPAEHIASGASVDAVRAAILDKVRAARKPVEMASVSVTVDETDRLRTAGVEAIGRRLGFERKPADGNPFEHMSLLEMARTLLERRGVNTSGMTRLELATRALFGGGTGDFPYILSNIGKKSLLAAYDAAPSTYELWTRTVDTNDFKPISRMRFSEAPDLVLKKEGGEYAFATFAEDREQYALATYGRKFSLTREAIINDDLSAFSRISTAFGNAARRLVNGLPYAILEANAAMADGLALFHSSHGNLASSDGEPSVSALEAAMAAFRRQTDISGNQVLNIVPEFILVPPELEWTTRQLMASTVDPDETNNVPNVLRGRLNVICDAELSDAKAWYLAASPSVIDTIEVCFLDGARAPVVESRENWDVDGIEFKVRLDVAAKAIDHRGLYKNAGK